MKLHNVVLVSLFTATLAACSKPTDATKGNFAKVLGPGMSLVCAAPVNVSGLGLPNSLNAYSGYNVDLTNGGFPLTVVWVKLPGFLRELDALVSAGLLTGKDLPEDPVAHRDNVLRGHRQQRQYALTDVGRKVLLSATSFCVAFYKLDEVVNFTAPSSAFGETMTKVTISVSAQPAPSWAHSTTFAAAFPDLAPKLQAKEQLDIPLVLMSDGWAPPRR